MNVIVGGGSGCIGRAICTALKSAGHSVRIVTRHPKSPGDLAWTEIKSSGLPPKTDAVLNFTGRNIGEVNPLFVIPKCYEDYVKELHASRIDTAKILATASKAASVKTFINASAVGFYKPSLDEVYTESDEFVDCGMISQLVRDWEAAAQIPDAKDIRQFRLRLGVVLSHDSHFIKAQYPSHRIGLGGPMGSGRQWISWVHLDDIVRAVEFLLPPTCKVPSGPVNMTAPNACRQAALSKALCESLGAPKLPFDPPAMPEVSAKLLVGSDRATLLLDGQRVVPKKLLDAGFEFKYPNLEDALCAIFGKRPSPVPVD